MSRSASIRMGTRPAELGLDPLGELRRRARPGRARQLVSVQGENQGRDAAHLKALRQCRFRVDIDLDEPRPGLDHRRRAFEFRRHDAARAAPFRPEIDQQRHIALLEVPLDPSIVILLFSAALFFPSIWAAEARNVILVPRRPVSAKHLLGPPVSVLPTPAAPVTWVARGWRKARYGRNSMQLNREELIRAWRDMMTIRRFEERVQEE